ncbi:phosphatidate phosphatase LPIN2 [Chanos chanos]|uniref:phosphatidate phosphatase n=1 Tax=Chanos chanos TaxID=29144 RepID=A0A6J2VME9_CHACN|nr:phosphatidate phosphatase LPIN2-like [Chanos chanos]
MNYVGQLAETVFVTVKELYRGLNPATLTGGIDVIVVRQPDGSLQCSPFHVRFGKLGVLRSKEKVVDIEINGEPVHLHMKLGDNGEAFFVEENENFGVEVPAHLCTSPIPIEVPENEEAVETHSSTSSSSSRRKKRRKKRLRSDTHLRSEGSSSSSEEREQPEQEAHNDEFVSPMVACKSVYYSLSEEPFEELPANQARDVHPHSDGECSPNENVFYSRSSSPKSDSELLMKSQESTGPQVHWDWGGFPEVCQATVMEAPPSPLTPSKNSHFRTIHRQDSFDMDSSDPMVTITVVRPEPRTVVTEPYPADTLPELSSPIAGAFPHTLPQVETLGPGKDTYLQSWSGLDGEEAQSSQRECTTNTLSMGSLANTANDTKTDTGAHTDNTTSPANTASSVTTNNNAHPATTISLDHLGNTDTVSASGTVSVARAARSVSTISIANAKSTESTVETIRIDRMVEKKVLVESRCEDTGRKTVLNEGDSGIDPSSEGADEEERELNIDNSQANQDAQTAGLTEAAEVSVQSEGQADLTESTSKAADAQEKKKAKRSQHLGPSDIYLDDLSDLDPGVAALYFPKRSERTGRALRDHSPERVSPSPPSGNQSPQSVVSGNMDSGTDYLSDSTSDTMDVSMSLCGGAGGTSQISKEKFMEHRVKYQDFVNNPGIIEDPNLVICINSKYYNWAVAAPMILSMQAFQKNLPKSTIEQLVKDKMPKKSGRWWFSWRKKDMDNNQANSKPDSEEAQMESPVSPSGPSLKEHSVELFSDEDTSVSLRQSSGTETMSQCLSQMYRKSLRLTSEQIERLNLREGANKVVFSVTTQYQGTCRCEAAIYLWNWDDKVIISDIDGTITKSDALGHILPQLGKDWTHQGIAKLYHKIHQNGYKFLYCSARAIGMADITKGYLQWVNDKGTVLPKGPVLLAPSSLFSALHREVIEKKPEVFKIACLTDIRDLFNPHRQPFYAAFGNRSNDVYAYKQVGVPEARIFTVNPKGELIQEKTKANKSSYAHLSEMVEHFFPVICKGQRSSFDCPEFSHFSYWREPLPPLDLSCLS